jgi:hypothetical protein
VQSWSRCGCESNSLFGLSSAYGSVKEDCSDESLKCRWMPYESSFVQTLQSLGLNTVPHEVKYKAILKNEKRCIFNVSRTRSLGHPWFDDCGSNVTRPDFVYSVQLRQTAKLYPIVSKVMGCVFDE